MEEIIQSPFVMNQGALMEELFLRMLIVGTWLFVAFVGYALCVHGCKKRGKLCLTLALLALSLMSLEPWGVETQVLNSLLSVQGVGAAQANESDFGKDVKVEGK